MRSGLIGKTLHQLDFRQQYGAIVLSIQRQDHAWRTNLESIPLLAGDVLLIQGNHKQIDALREEPGLTISEPQAAEVYQLEERLMMVQIPAELPLVGKTLMESRLGESFGLGVLGIVRHGETQAYGRPRGAVRG